MGNDLTWNVVALDRASATVIKIAEKLDGLADRLDRLDGKDVRVNVNVKTDESNKLLDSFSNRFALMTAGIVAASPLVGAAILGGIGGGFVGIAALAQKSNKDVQQTYTTLWHNVVTETKNATDQLVPQIVGAGKSIDAEMQKLGPSMNRAFSYAGPSIVALTHGVTDFAQNAMPGAETAMQNSLPVAEGVSAVMSKLGTTFSDTATKVSQHSSAFGIDLQSFGNIADTAVGTATNVVVDLGTAWAQNAAKIDSAVAGTGASISGLAQGALPVFSGALDVVFTAVNGVVTVLRPVAPILGVVGTGALAAWAAFKLAGLAEAGVKSLAMGVVTLGGNMQASATKAGLMIAAQKGVEVESLMAARAVTAAGAASATAAVGFGAAAEAIAGPLGIALVAGVALYALFSDSQGNTAQSTMELKAATDSLTSAFEASNGVVTISVESILQSTSIFKEAAGVAAKLGISQAELTRAIVDGGPAMDMLRMKLQLISKEFGSNSMLGGKALEDLVNAFHGAQKAAADLAAAHEEQGRKALATGEFHLAAARSAGVLGISLQGVKDGFIGVFRSGTQASGSAQDVAVAFAKSALTIATAQQAITDHFASADKAVVQANRSVADAAHSYEQSTRSIADAQHSLVNAQRSVVDAHKNVENAQKAVTKAEDQEKTALISLNAAREKAVQDLKDLHLQLEDQVTSEESARVRLFEAAQAAAGHGVTTGNAASIAAQSVSASNVDQVKAAIDLVSAQNTLNDTLSSGEKLREDVAAADQAGVEGAPGVVAAQQALQSAHEQVASAVDGLARAQQQETDASYAAQQAQRQLGDAMYQGKRAAEQLTIAQQNLKDAQAAASRTFDLSTKAGQENLALMNGLWDAINKTGLRDQEKYNLMVADTAKAFGVSTDAAAGYLKQVNLIPQDFKYTVTALASVDYTTLLGDVQRNGGKIFKGMATGGQVVGMGGPRDDSNLIWASHGEFMQPADAVDHYGVGFMEAVRKKKLRVVGTDGAALPGYATGGPIEGNAQLAAVGSQYASLDNALGVMGFPRVTPLPAYVPPAAGVVNYTAGAGVAQWAPQILQALGQLGQSAGWLSTVERRMNQESGGNPTVVNRWDSNWLRGTPSVGLMQVIGPTFRSNAGPYLNTGPFSYGVSVDPSANIFSGLNYAIHRYGSLSALNRPGGYDHGGKALPGWTALFNGTGRPENVRSADVEDELLRAVREPAKVLLGFAPGASRLEDLLITLVREYVQVRGGNVQAVLGQ